ncbi:MAG TPA: ribosome small subunit-dependent GTPase A [Anaeromyxobacteraceae bacterium]|nr:ribosome small subunit-dependent GTPase A [Anaeromyxobacteraceae bacterium]
MSLRALGWNEFFSAQLSPDEGALAPARVVADHGGRVEVRHEGGASLAAVPARLRGPGVAPVVGDFVLLSPGRPEPAVRRVLERRTWLSRKAAGRETAEQVLAANVDLAFVVQGLDGDASPRRLERYLAAVHAGGIRPVVLLSKVDLIVDPAPWVEAAAAAAPGVEVLPLSARTGQGLDAVRSRLAPGVTAVLAGSSGVGKSTLVNALLGEDAQRTAEVRARDRRGRHTTGARRLFLLPGGGALIDGPGMRELALWDDAGLDAAFPDVGALAAACRFRDCRHEDEPGCAVRAAVREGRLDPGRLEGLRKLARETEIQAQRRDAGAAAAERRRWKAIHKEVRRGKKRGWW